MIMNSTESERGAAAVEPARGLESAFLCETAWEVCHQMGGIYTVVRSKVPSMVKAWGVNYGLVGPYQAQSAAVEFEESELDGPMGQAVASMRAAGFDVHGGRWLITGHPPVVLLNPESAFSRLAEIKYLIWEHHGVSILASDALVDRVLAFGYMVEQFFRFLAQAMPGRRLIGQFHEWMAGTAIPEIRRARLPVGVVFTTHATLLGRYMAMSDAQYVDRIAGTDWRAAARGFNIEAQVMLERAAAHGAHVFTTVSEVTAYECEHLLGRKPDVLLPNGLNIERFTALHEFQNLHRKYKDKISQFVMGQFFPSYTFDLERTLYFFTSGRYEYANKGFDLTIEALARLNWRMKQTQSDKTVVFFLITRAASHSINAEVLRRRAVMEEIRNNCEAIQKQVGDRLFMAAAMRKSPSLDTLPDEYWRLRLRRSLQAWRSEVQPAVTTYDLVYDQTDAVMQQLRSCNLLNWPGDPVKVVYHPEFISSADPLFGMDYDQFVRGCHYGVFPSFYEPWGYAPLECLVLGIPSVTSDMTGFGAYVMHNIPDHEARGLNVIRRQHATFDQSAGELADRMFRFIQLDRRERIAMRNSVEGTADQFDWRELGRHYRTAHEMALAQR
jgi:glycogen(starch) synthase